MSSKATGRGQGQGSRGGPLWTAPTQACLALHPPALQPAVPHLPPLPPSPAPRSMHLPNIGAALEVVLATVRSGARVVLATSPVIANEARTEPTHIKVVPPATGDATRTHTVQWITHGGTAPAVQWGAHPAAVGAVRSRGRLRCVPLAGPGSRRAGLRPHSAALAPPPAPPAGLERNKLKRVARADTVAPYTKQMILDACGWGTRPVPDDAFMLSGAVRGGGRPGSCRWGRHAAPAA